jgi:hypothetical protein
MNILYIYFVIENEGGWVRQNTTVVGSYLLVLMMTRMTSLILVVGEQIKCFLSSLRNAHANVADGQWVIVGGLARVTRCQQFRIIHMCNAIHT